MEDALLTFPVHDGADRVVGAGDPLGVRAHRPEIDRDRGAEIDLGISLEVDEAEERELAVAFGVDADDRLAAAPKELVDAEVLDVSAVRAVEEGPVPVRVAKRLRQEVTKAEP